MLFLHQIFFLISNTDCGNLAYFLSETVGRALENNFLYFCLFQRHVLDLMKLAVAFNPFFKQKVI